MRLTTILLSLIAFISLAIFLVPINDSLEKVKKTF
jgi:hypothetical protein